MSLKRKDQKKQVVDKKLLETLSDKDLQMIVGGQYPYDPGSLNYICFLDPRKK